MTGMRVSYPPLICPVLVISHLWNSPQNIKTDSIGVNFYYIPSPHYFFTSLTMVFWFSFLEGKGCTTVSPYSLVLLYLCLPNFVKLLYNTSIISVRKSVINYCTFCVSHIRVYFILLCTLP